jgi:putative nucleotidyltransferase with HDIG domain
MDEGTLVISDLLRKAGQLGYIGEDVSQLEHALQTAHLASKSGAGPEVILAALLHDIGHYYDDNNPQMDNVGTLNHEALGGEFLSKLGFSARVVALVQGHVNAKRYLVSTRSAYRKNLSPASQRTLEFQGGVMSAKEIQEFESHENFENLLKLRAWDDQAKIKGLRVPDLDSYNDLVASHLLAAAKRGT